MPYGGVMVCDYADSITNYSPIAYLTPPTDGSWRVVGFGYELTNTTPVMYQSGTLLSYQSPYIGGTVSSVPIAEVGVASPLSDVRYVIPVSGRELPAPFTFSEASSLPTAKQWESKHGAYVIPRLTSFDSPFMAPMLDETSNTVINVATKHGDHTTVNANTGIVAGEMGFLLPDTINRIAPDTPRDITRAFMAPTPTMPYTSTGIHLTGLSPQSTFSLVVTWYV